METGYPPKTPRISFFLIYKRDKIITEKKYISYGHQFQK